MKHGQFPLCLTPYHPDLNPIELAWGEVKGEVTCQNIGLSSLENKKKNKNKVFSEYSLEK